MTGITLSIDLVLVISLQNYKKENSLKNSGVTLKNDGIKFDGKISRKSNFP